MATCYDCVHYCACSDAGDSGFSCLKEDVSKCKHFVRSADVVERKRGEWIAKPQEFYIDTTDWMCSVCKEEFCPIDMVQDDFFKMMKFCPNCGADMRGGER